MKFYMAIAIVLALVVWAASASEKNPSLATVMAEEGLIVLSRGKCPAASSWVDITDAYSGRTLRADKGAKQGVATTGGKAGGKHGHTHESTAGGDIDDAADGYWDKNVSASGGHEHLFAGFRLCELDL